jgi:hypothetical protein
MGRILLVVAMAYGWGCPGFNGERPRALDRPLRDFHRAVDGTARDALRAIKLLDDARSMRYLAPLMRAL